MCVVLCAYCICVVLVGTNVCVLCASCVCVALMGTNLCNPVCFLYLCCVGGDRCVSFCFSGAWENVYL